MTDPDETAGRHGGDGGGGLTVAELIARSRAAAGAAPARPSRSTRRSELAVAEPGVESAAGSMAATGSPVVTEPATATGAAAPTRHLSVVDASPHELPAVEDIVVAPSPRGGRNLPAAIGVGLGLGAL